MIYKSCIRVTIIFEDITKNLDLLRIKKPAAQEGWGSGRQSYFHCHSVFIMVATIPSPS